MNPMNLCCGVFCEIFGYILEQVVFLEGLLKLREIRNIEDFGGVLKLEFVVND